METLLKTTFTEHEVTVINPEEGASFGYKDFDDHICSLDEEKQADLDTQDEDRAFHANGTHGVQR